MLYLPNTYKLKFINHSLYTHQSRHSEYKTLPLPPPQYHAILKVKKPSE